MIEAAVLGATGYTGFELIRLLIGHPQVKPVFISSESRAGSKLSQVHPQLAGAFDLELENLNVERIPASVEVVFCALPHGQSCSVVPQLLQRGFKVIDLSADFRLKAADQYDTWYGRNHPAPHCLEGAVYGLPELYPSEINQARLLANPGCYPTSIILALAPLLSSGRVASTRIIIDAKSGVSGAGRSPKQAFHFPECTENFKAYRVANHQHTPEIEQELSRVAGEKVRVTFTPHLAPMIRGILSTIYIDLPPAVSFEEVYSFYSDQYGKARFVRLLEPPAFPETRLVRGSNYCDISLTHDRRTGSLIIISAIDNLLKGASGQALQNMNIMFGLPEETGLEQIPAL